MKTKVFSDGFEDHNAARWTGPSLFRLESVAWRNRVN